MAVSDTIESERLYVEPFSEKFLTGDYVGWLSDPEVVRYSEQRFRRHTLDSCREYWRSFDDTPNYFWAIVRKNDRLHLGNINAYVDVINNTADVGILIGCREAWRKGYGAEAWNAVCGYLFHSVGVRKVTAGTISNNEAMLGIMRSTGMVEDGRRIRHVLFEGLEVDMVHAALFREDIV